MEYKFWVNSESRAEAIKKAFSQRETSLITFKQESDGSTEITLTDPNSSDLLALFHAGISFGLREVMYK